MKQICITLHHFKLQQTADLQTDIITRLLLMIWIVSRELRSKYREEAAAAAAAKVLFYDPAHGLVGRAT